MPGWSRGPGQAYHSTRERTQYNAIKCVRRDRDAAIARCKTPPTTVPHDCVAKYSASNRSTEEPYEEVSCPIPTILPGGKERLDFTRSELSVKASFIRLEPQGIVSKT
jgi:hypothetical protein